MVARGQTLTRRKLVEGVGINDVDFPTQREAFTDSLGIYHPFWIDPIYQYWRNILIRTHNEGFRKRNPAYYVVNVCEQWKSLSCFYGWAKVRDFSSKKVLDKDILGDGTIYEPNSCCFVTERVNNFLVGSKIKKELPLGVTWEADRQKYKAEIAWNKKSNRLGNFHNKWEAHLVYCKKKLELSYLVIEDEGVEDYVASALIAKLQKKVDEAEILYQQSLI